MVVGRVAGEPYRPLKKLNQVCDPRASLTCDEAADRFGEAAGAVVKWRQSLTLYLATYTLYSPTASATAVHPVGAGSGEPPLRRSFRTGLVTTSAHECPRCEHEMTEIMERR